MRDVRKPLHAAAEGDGALRNAQLETDASEARKLLTVVRGTVVEAGPAHALLREPVEVDVGRDALLFVAEPLRLGQPRAVLVDQRVSIPREVRRRFALPGG